MVCRLILTCSMDFLLTQAHTYRKKFKSLAIDNASADKSVQDVQKMLVICRFKLKLKLGGSISLELHSGLSSKIWKSHLILVVARRHTNIILKNPFRQAGKQR